jgi:hypothetical protein
LKQEILIALLIKKVEERFQDLPDNSPLRGPRGQRGQPGRDGKNFDFKEHEEIIKSWAKEFALKFEDLSEEQINSLKGQKGKDGKDFNFSEYEDKIKNLCKEAVESISDSLKLKFSDLTEEEINALRGPRGREGLPGRDGKDFNFEEHREFFNSLKLTFSDLTEEDLEKLKLHFSDLTEEDKNSLKLKFKDLSDEEKLTLRGARGPRGQRGRDGIDGKNGLDGKDGKNGRDGAPGKSVIGQRGKDGRDGKDGVDAPYVTDIRIDEIKSGEIIFIFEFSDGSEIKTNSISLPQSNVYNSYVISKKVVNGGGGSDPTVIDGTGATVNATDDCIIYSNPVADQEIFLPTAGNNKKVTIKFLTDFNVTITPDSISETIDNETSLITNAKLSAINLRSKSGLWYIF